MSLGKKKEVFGSLLTGKSQWEVDADENLMDSYIKAAKCFVTLSSAEFTRMLKCLLPVLFSCNSSVLDALILGIGRSA